MLKFDPIFDPWLLILLWGIAAAGAISCYRRRYLRGKSRGQRLTLASSRCLVWLILLFLALRPSLSVLTTTEEKSRVIVLRDLSESMEILDMPGGRSRQQAVEDVIVKHKADFDVLIQSFDVEWYGFARDFRPLEEQAEVRRNGSALGDGLAAAAALPTGSPVDCIIVISDGISNSGRSHTDGAVRLAQRRVKVHSVIVGQSSYAGDFVDGIVMDIRCPPTVQNNKEMTIAVDGIFRGLAERDCRIQCLIDESLEIETVYRPTRNQEVFRKNLAVAIALEPGFHRLTVELPALAGEISPHNNRLSTYFKVKEEGIRVLYLESVIRPEYKFLKRLLAADEGLTLTAKSPFWLRTDAGRDFLRDLDVHRYDVLIIGDLERNAIARRTWRNMNDMVRNRGAGLLLLGGSLNLAPSFLAGNPIARTVPIIVGGGEPRVMQFRPRLVKANADHFLVEHLRRLGSDDLDWSAISMQGIRNSDITATTFAKTLIADENGMPLLAVDTYHRGRCAALATDCTWNWLFDDAAPGNMYPHLWTRMIYWLASREDGLTAQLGIFIGHSRFRSGDEIVVTADLMDDNNIAVAGANISLDVETLPDKGRRYRLPMVYESGRYIARFSPDRVGDFSLRATADWQGSELHSNALRLSVFEPRVEDKEIAANPAVMRAIAERTGGEFLRLEALGNLLKTLPREAKIVKVEKVESATTLWDRWWVLVAFLAAAGFDWIFRRRSGLP